MIDENEVSQPTSEEMPPQKADFDNAEGLGENVPHEDSEGYSPEYDETEEYSKEYADGDTEEETGEDISDEASFDMNEDIRELKEEFPELWGLASADELQNKEKYLRFRSLGLTPAEAYMASGGIRVKERPRPTSPLSVKRRDEVIPDRQLRMARELFSEMSDTEIQALYKRVTK